MREKEIENLTDKNIRDFTDSDTLYIQKPETGFSVNYLVQFISFKSGIVTGKVISADGYPKIQIGEQITARATKCYLWGKDEEDAWRSRCHWFQADGFVK